MKTIIAILLTSFALSVGAKDLKPLPDMTTSSLPSAKDAEDALIGYLMKNHECLSATAAAAAKVSFTLGHEIANFGEQGDRVWQVHLVEFGETKRIAWINAESNNVHFIYPEEEKIAEPIRTAELTPPPRPILPPPPFSIQNPDDEPPVTYNVREGDTLESIAKAFSTTPQRIITLNALETTNLTSGMTLSIQLLTQ